MHLVLTAHLLVMAALVAGCSGKDSAATGGGGKPGSTALPGLDPGSRLDLDGGRVSVFSPQGWRRAPRSYDYLVRYQATPQFSYPSIIVLAGDPPEGFSEVTDDNRAAFVEAIAGRVVAADGKGVLRKPARAKVGPHHAVNWAAAGDSKLDGKSKKIERDCTAVVIAGRLYTVEAWGLRGRLDDAARAAARAVAAGLALPSLEPAETFQPLLPPTEPAPEPTDPAKEPAASVDEAPKPDPPAAEPEAPRPAAAAAPSAE